MAKLMNIDIVTPEKRIFEGKIKELTAPGTDGEFGVLPEHAAFATALEPGVVTIVKENGEKDMLAVSGGYIEVTREKIVLLVESAERAGEVDLETLKRRKEEKEKLLKTKDRKDVDYDMIQVTLAREIARLRANEILGRRKK
ncbi:MAG: F0F1 ATP synthase subunit epsilon [bacterium]